METNTPYNIEFSHGTKGSFYKDSLKYSRSEMVNPTLVIQVHQTSVMKMEPAAMNLVASHMFVLQYNAINLDDGGWYTFSYHVEVVQVKLVVQVGGVQVK